MWLNDDRFLECFDLIFFTLIDNKINLCCFFFLLYVMPFMFIQVKVYRKEANYGKAMTLESSAFVPSGDAFVKIMLVWGMKPRDFSDCHKSDYLCTGSQVWDDVVDMNNPLAQVALQVNEVCLFSLMN